MKTSTYVCKIGLMGISEIQSGSLLQNIRDEYVARDIECHVVYNRAIAMLEVDVQLQCVDLELGKKQVVDELFQISCSVIGDVEGMTIKLIGVNRIY